MENQPQQFVGAPCGQFGPYTFYSGFKYCKNGKPKELNLGDFFFVRISREEDPCIGELQFLTTNRNNDHQLSSLRLYFLPEQTPDGRLPHHGEDEVLVVADRVVLKLDDLVSWITEEVEWNHGNMAPCCPGPPQIAPKKEIKEESPDTETSATTNGSGDDGQKNQLVEIKQEKNNESTVKVELDQPKGTKVVVFSYPAYCRYRCMLKRLEGSPDFDTLLRDPIVIALGGFSPTNKKTRVLFCRDSFEHDELAHHELNVEYLAPTLKGKRRKRKTKNTRSISPESITSEECKDVVVKNEKTNGLKQPPVKNEQEFLQRLFKFMKKRNTPIHRVPHLGFKQIDLYIFYCFAQKLGGYDKITTKKLWKQVYDELGGNPSSTSAATCTRRHYEKLLLPFERHMDGIAYKPNNRGKKSQKKKQQEKEKETSESAAAPPAKAEPVPSTSAEAEDAYAFTDSNHENSNSKDSNSNEFHSVAEEQAVANEVPFSDEDSKTVWSIQKQPENKDEADKDENKSIKPLIIQKGQGESFAEKERKWDEIRRKSAEARKWVRQSRSNSQGSKNGISKTPSEKSSSVTSETSEVISAVPETVKGKSETKENAPVPNVPPFTSSVPVEAKRNVLPQAVDQGAPKLHPPLGNAQNLHNVISKIENKKRLQLQALEQQSKISPEKKNPPPSHTKAEPAEKYAKSWCGYSASSDHSSMYSGPDSIAAGASKTQPPAGYKTGPRSEPDVNRDYLMQHTGRQSVGSISASSAVSVEASTNEEKPLVPQRRPSVIQHTEYAATSPSPSISPMQNNSDICRNVSPKDTSQSAAFSSPKMNLLPNQLSGYSMTGKVAEWLTKGVHEVVACKTPSAVVEKTVELHDQVMMPSSCKTPGAVGSSKISNNNTRNKHNTCATKSQRSKYSTSHRHRNSDNIANGNSIATKNDARNNAIYQKTFHPTPTTYNSVMTNAAAVSKYQQSINPSAKPDFYPHSPYYNQTKRFKCNNVLPTALPPMNIRPSLTPFIRQQVYRTSPLSDIPKTTATTHNDYDAVVLDLSLKKKPAHSAPVRTVVPVVAVGASAVPDEGVCLDLSIKKSNSSNDNGIENITPPLPLSPNPPSQLSSSYLHPSLKPLPTLISLQDFRPQSEATGGHGYPSGTNRMPPIMTSSATVTASGAPLMHPGNPMFPMGTHSKLPPGMINTMPGMAYSKDIAKNMYMPSTTRHSQFSPYVIPPFFPTNWTSVVSAAPTNTKQMNNSQTSPVTYKGMINHSVFPKDYPSQYKSQFHPVLCKDNGHYPSSGK